MGIMGRTIEELLKEMDLPEFDIIESEDDELSWFEKKLEEMEEDDDEV